MKNLMVWLMLAFFGGFIAGCQTVRGVAHDFGSVTNYVQEQIPPTDSRDQ